MGKTLDESTKIEPNVGVPTNFPKQTEAELYHLINTREPLILDNFEGTIFMRGSCGTRPCKGHYQ